MSHQNHAPPEPGEATVDVAKYSGPMPRPFEVWPDRGWCSACLVDGLRVVRFGDEARHVAMCIACLTRIAGALGASLTSRTPNDEGRST